MSQFVLDDKTAAQLQAAGGLTEIVTASGKHIGYFCPYDPTASVKGECPYTEEELERLRLDPANRQGKPLSQVWETLRQRGVKVP